MKRLAVLGTGSWGTALAVHHAMATGEEVVLWGRSPEWVEKMRSSRANERYLPGVELPESLRLTSDLADVATCDLLMVVVPSHGFRATLRRLMAELGPSHGSPPILISATKGVETETLQRMSEVTREEARAAGRTLGFAALTGPTFAAELVRRSPTAAVVASDDAGVAKKLQHRLSSSRFRLYSTSDVVGVELGGASKNVIAIAAGVVTGLGLGHNTLAALLTRGLHEITRLGLAYGGDSRTFAGLAGMGDLVLTCTGGLSRNRRLGMELAAGKDREDVARATPMVAEGVRNSLAIARLAAQKLVEMPITEKMVQVLYHGESPTAAVESLMTRELRSEAEL